MKKAVLALTILLASAPALMAQLPYDETCRKATRAFDAGEWATASALYNFMIHKRPADISAYAPAIVAAEAMGDSIRPMQLLTQSLQHGASVDSIISLVRQSSFKAARPQMFEPFLLEAKNANPWLRRPIDAQLLRWAEFRHDGPAIVTYARTMLQGLPTSAQFLNALAQGYMLCDLPQKAVETWTECLRHHPDNLPALLALGNYYTINNRRDQALPFLTRAFAIAPTPRLQALISR